VAESVIVSAVRTPTGKFLGALKGFTAPQLGALAVAEAVRRAGIDPAVVDECIMGNVVSAGLGQNPARQAALHGGLPDHGAALTVNKVCGSGLKAVMLAAQAIQCGDASVIVAGGTENMSRAPYLLESARGGYRMGNGEIVDAMIKDGLWDVYNNVHMGTCGDRCAEKYSFTRQQQDDYAVNSFKRALEATAKGRFAQEIEPVQVKAGRDTILVAEDETPKKFNEEKLRKLRPAFGERGTITAGNASSINDGAAALVVVSPEKIQMLGIKAQARILGYATFSCEPEWFTIAPIGAQGSFGKRVHVRPAAC